MAKDSTRAAIAVNDAKKSNTMLARVEELGQNTLVRLGTVVGVLVFLVGGSWSARGWMSKMEIQAEAQTAATQNVADGLKSLASKMESERKEDSKAMWEQVATIRTEIRDLRDKIIRLEAKQP